MSINVDKIVKADRHGIIMFIHIIKMSDNEITAENVISSPDNVINLLPGNIMIFA
jgi:hypothetical protein